MEICIEDDIPSFEVSYYCMMGFSVFNSKEADSEESFFMTCPFFNEEDLYIILSIKRQK